MSKTLIGGGTDHGSVPLRTDEATRYTSRYPRGHAPSPYVPGETLSCALDTVTPHLPAETTSCFSECRQKVARLVQAAMPQAAYMTCLRWTNEHIASHPDRMTKEERALAIVEMKAPEHTD